VSQLRAGFVASIAANLLWGLFPLYWPLLKPAGEAEILAHRMIWSAAVLALVLSLTSGFRWARSLGRRRVLLLCLAAVLITINWGMYIYGVNSGHVVEASLGYFINPLVTVALAVAFLGERMRSLQWAAVAIAALAVIVLAVDYGHPPWIALTLAISFALYGFVKKRVGIDGVHSLSIETAFLLVPASSYVIWLQASGRGTFVSDGVGHALLLIGAGVVTAVPLILYGAATYRVPLAVVGLMQYLMPVIQFLIGVLVDHEAMPPGRLAGFALVWVALGVFTVDALRSLRAGGGLAQPVAAAPAAQAASS
jgi:chloramphenicol-sensitive protein RarD